MFLAVCSILAASWLARQRVTGWAAVTETGAVVFSGLVSTVFMTGHLVAITVGRLNGEWAHRYNHHPPADVVFVGSFPYDFRYYSMALVAAVVLAAGVSGLRSARALARGNRGARLSAMKANAVLVATIVPLLPCAHFVRLLLIPALLALGIGMLRAVQRRRPIAIRRLAAGASGD